MNTQTRTADKTRGASHLVTKRLPKRAPLYVAAGSIILAIVLTLVIAHGFNIPLAAFLAGVINLAVIVGWSWSVEGRRKAVDRAATTLVTSSFALALIPLISLLWMSIEKGGPVIVENSTLLSRSMEGMKGVYDKDFAAGQGDLLGGFYHAIIGTLLLSLIHI